MKFRFTIQQHQTDAVRSTVDVFVGQPFRNSLPYLLDLDKKDVFDYGQKNADLLIDSETIFSNIREIQKLNDIKQSSKLVSSQGLGACILDIEMETGTGKTYVYIKTMFELKKAYGWNKFIVIVPTVAIREGVAKSFSILEDHFMELYGEKVRVFVYNSKQLSDIVAFANSDSLSVIIINMQAFSSSLKPDGTQKDAKIINSERDVFGSRRPIDVIAETRPILILDEPQKLEGLATLNGMKRFKPLFAINYSATHKTKHNLIYALDAVDAFRKKLVKRIEVKGFEFQNNLGVTRFAALTLIEPSKAGPVAWIEHDVRQNSGIKRTRSRFMCGDSLYAKSNNLNEYDNFVVTDIDDRAGFVEFQNGLKLSIGDVVGDQNTDAVQRIQIAETIRSHLEKERELFVQGIKTLSLFFIDQVANYRREYDANGTPVKAKFERWFEEEYLQAQKEMLATLDVSKPEEKNYFNYLNGISAEATHAGYFAVDSKNKIVDSEQKRDGNCNDVSAYDLILKNKERLLSFEEPTRFIFSHSALQEGWDNPNIFQICTLRSTHSAIKKRQEVGRGLRLCVNQAGYRQDVSALGERVHKVNTLTVIANENYKDFVSALQNETRETLRDRPETITEEFLTCKVLRLDDGREHVVTADEAAQIKVYLQFHDYIDAEGHITEIYKKAQADGTIQPLPSKPSLDKVRPFADALHKGLQALYDSSLDSTNWISNALQPKLVNSFNQKNFDKDEFQELWKQICPKFSYSVKYDSEELIKKAIDSIDKNLVVSRLSYRKVTGIQTEADVFEQSKTSAPKAIKDVPTNVKYDLVGDVAKGAMLTRRTTARILSRIAPDKFSLYPQNPEEFIKNVAKLIREQKATMIVQHLSYHRTTQSYGSEIFTLEKSKIPVDSVIGKKHVMDYVVTDSKIEKELAQSLELAEEVSVYAKLPRSFQIPTPVGNYAPDWAIAFKKGSFKHVFFVAETKGSMDSMQLSAVEREKIECAKKLFNEANLTGDVRYHQVATYTDLLNEIQRLEG